MKKPGISPEMMMDQHFWQWLVGQDFSHILWTPLEYYTPLLELVQGSLLVWDLKNAQPFGTHNTPSASLLVQGPRPFTPTTTYLTGNQPVTIYSIHTFVTTSTVTLWVICLVTIGFEGAKASWVVTLVRRLRRRKVGHCGSTDQRANPPQIPPLHRVVGLNCAACKLFNWVSKAAALHVGLHVPQYWLSFSQVQHH
jgi:hypothetical protein